MATHSSILAWRIPWTEEPGGLSPWGHKESDMTEQLTQNTHLQGEKHNKLRLFFLLPSLASQWRFKWKNKRELQGFFLSLCFGFPPSFLAHRFLPEC